MLHPSEPVWPPVLPLCGLHRFDQHGLSFVPAHLEAQGDCQRPVGQGCSGTAWSPGPSVDLPERRVEKLLDREQGGALTSPWVGVRPFD